MGGIATLGEALDHGWKVRAFCDFGKRDHTKSVRECMWRRELDLETLVCTRGRAFPLADLATRLKCPTCGSRRMRVYFEPPSVTGRQSTPATA
jgi:hypothetical protein